MEYRPYVDTTLYPPFDISSVPDCHYFALGFIVADSANRPSWGGYYATTSNYYKPYIDAVRAKGGDVTFSFGGAAGKELALVTGEWSDLYLKYASVIKTYDAKSIDFDIEGKALLDKPANIRRARAVLELTRTFPKLQISLTLPVSEKGLTKEGLRLVESTPCNLVNIMAMDYGYGQGRMAEFAISAAQATRKQTGKKIGITVMIGMNDIIGEVFTLDDAHVVKDFADSKDWITRLSIWSINRDNGDKSIMEKSSMIDQHLYEFSKIFK